MPNYSAKSDQGKTDWSLLPWRSTELAAEIMTQAIRPKSEGGSGYSLASWRIVPGGYYRFWAALMRHVIRRFVYDEVIDPESGKPHLTHAMCCLMFICEIDLEVAEKLKKSNGTEDWKKENLFYKRDV